MLRENLKSSSTMDDSLVKSMVVFTVWIAGITSPQAIFSMITSIVATIYFIAMLKINVVDKKYGGDWILFVKSWFKK